MGVSLQVVCPECNSTNSVPEGRLADGPLCGKCKQSLFAARPLELQSSTFFKHIGNNYIPVVVDFWASWCGPCKMMAPVIEQAAARLEPGIRMAKVNTETEQELALKFNIRSIPTMIVFKKGQEIARQTGAQDLAQLIQWIQSSI